MQPLRVGFLIDEIHSPTAGTELQLLGLLQHLDRRAVSPMLFVLRETPWVRQEFDLCPYRILHLDSLCSIDGFMSIFKAARIFKEENLQVLQCYFNDSMLAGALAGRLAGVRTIVGAFRNQSYWDARLMLLALRATAPMFAGYVANSEATRKWATRTRGVSPNRVETIYNGLAIEPELVVSREDCSRRQVREELGLAEGELTVGVVANLRPVKGVDCFLRAAAKVAKRTKARFVIVGEGDQRAELKTLARSLCIEDRVLFLGARRDVGRLLRGFDVGVLPSRSESFSSALLEYLAAGLPVVCTDTGGCREIVREGDNGFIVAVEDWQALAEAILEIDRRYHSGSPLVVDEKKIVEDFSFQNSAKKHEAYYRRLAG